MSDIHTQHTAVKPTFTVTRVLKGFEFGHGTISGVAAKQAILEKVDEVIHTDTNIIVPVDSNDDGCGDGREVLTIFSLDQKFKRSLNRPKVFGGSATMATACSIGLGEAKGCTLNELFNRTIKDLDKKSMDFGAHTDENMHGRNCGCGAIDKAPQIIFAALKYELPIRGAITTLSEDVSGINEIFSNFRQYAATIVTDTEYSGMQVMDTILKNKQSRVVKQLGGAHRECRIVLNKMRDFTVNQKLIREATDGEAQIFGVDVWRMEDIAKRLYEHDVIKRHQALISELVYTLATAAVLTKGDLPVDMISAS